MSLEILGWTLLLLPVGAFLYAYVLYPLLLWLVGLAAAREDAVPGSDPADWPPVSISLPAYNEERTIAGALDALMEVDYPRDRLQVLVTSDASDDATDEIVRSYAERGVELFRLAERGGKTAAENAASEHLRGDLVINTDASIRIGPRSIKPLVRALADPTVGVASGRDVSVGGAGTDANVGETGYVGYEMWVRALESRRGSIVGASGCFYAIRRDLHAIPVPEALSRDFAAALKARKAGYRSVHVPSAVCFVPRTGSPRLEYRRKVRTMARGLDTLRHYRELLNPFRYGQFAFSLLSHKLARWVVPPLLPLGVIGLALLAVGRAWPRWVLLAGALGCITGWAALNWPRAWGRTPRPIALAGFAVSANVAGILAWVKSLRERGSNPIWEPTRRAPIPTAGADPGSTA